MLFLTWASPGLTQAAESAPLPAIIILLGPVTPSQLWDTTNEHLSHLSLQGAKGLMSVNTGTRNAHAAYLTLGSGGGATSLPHLDPACNRDEWWWEAQAIDCWQRRLGQPDGGAEVVHLGITQLLQSQTAPVGLLGDVLSNAGRRVMIVGNADGAGWHREAVAMAMTGHGTILWGDVGPDLVMKDATAPFGVRTDYNVLLDLVEERPEVDTLFIHAGDVERALRYGAYTTKGMTELHVERSLRDLDRMVGELLTRFPPETSLWAILPAYTPAQEAPLVPVILAGPSFSPGLLVTPTTRRVGLVSNTDILPTLLTHLSLPVPAMVTGQVIQSSDTRADSQVLHRAYHRAVRNYHQRGPILKTYITIQGLVVLLGMGATLLGVPLPRHSSVLFLTLALIPLLTLTWPYLPGGWEWAFSRIVLLSLLVAAGCYLISGRQWRQTLVLISALGTLVLALDLVRGQSLMVDTPFGYSTALGARYYGLGNEYMGYLIGLVLMGSAALLESGIGRRWLATVAWQGLAGLLIAGPGVNVGGSLTLLGGSLVFLHWVVPGRAFDRRIVLIPTGLILATLGASSWWGYGHWGNAWRKAMAGDMDFLRDIANRKLAVNLRLLNWTVWSQALLVLLGAYLVLSWRPVGLVKRVRSRYPYLQAGANACAVGSVLAIITNDSGIVAAATLMIPAITGWMLALIPGKTPPGP